MILWGPHGATTITCTLQGRHCSSWIPFDLLHTSQSREIWGLPQLRTLQDTGGPQRHSPWIGRSRATGSGSSGSRGGEGWEFRFPRSNLSCSGRNEEIPVGTRTCSKSAEEPGLPNGRHLPRAPQYSLLCHKLRLLPPLSHPGAGEGG